MTKYCIYVKVSIGQGLMGWKPLRPTSAAARAIKDAPYQFATRDDAVEMAEICYPDQIRQAHLGGEQVIMVQPAGMLPDGSYPTKVELGTKEIDERFNQEK